VITNKTIYVRYTPLVPGCSTGNITHASTGATTQNISVTGVAYYSLPMSEDFNYSVGSYLNANGWAVHSGAGTNPITVTGSGLTYTGYTGSGVGNAVTLVTTGEDVNKTFSVQKTGSVYCSFLVNITSAQTGGDYFIHFGTNPWTTNFYSRVYVKNDGSGNISFGISKGAGTAVYTAATYSLNTTYLVVFKYTFVADDALPTNDVSSLFIFIDPNLPTTEPIPTITSTDASSDDTSGIGGVGLRQGSTSTSPVVIIDGIRTGTSWQDTPLPVTLESFTNNVNNNNVNLTWKTGKEMNNKGFEVLRNNIKIGFVEGKNTASTYTYSDNNLQPGSYTYKLKQIDFNGNYQCFNLSGNVIISTPKKFSVEQNYPNPFNPVTKIVYSIPQDSKVTVKIFDVLGREVYSLSQQQLAGYHDFPFDASSFSSGIYFYKITAGDFIAIKKMLFIK